MDGETHFKGVSYINYDMMTNNILYGMKDFCTWAMLQIGGFQNITRSSPATSGIFGGDRSCLRPVYDVRYTDGQVWEGFRGDWVWETGINFTVQPIRVSGVWVTDIFRPLSGVGPYSHYIDYPRGRVIFNTAIAKTSNVQASFSPRYCSFMDSDHPWIRKLMYDSFDIQKGDFLAWSSGNWSEWADIRAQLPVVGVEVSPMTTFKPFQIGGGQWVYKDILLYVFADNPFDRNQITDILSSQNDFSIYIPDYGKMKEQATWPFMLDYRGSPVISGFQYPYMVSASGYQWRGVYLTDTRAQNMEPINNVLYRSVVRQTMQIIMEDI
jgi:hypothetical protein